MKLSVLKMGRFPLFSLLFLLSLGSSFVSALAPPFFERESLRDYRARNNITFQYRTKYISAEHCRFLSEEKCRRDDEAHASSLAETMREQRRLNPSIIRNGQTFKVPVLLLRFADHENVTLPPASYFESMFNGEKGEGPNLLGSVADYVRYASMDQYRVEFDIIDWETVEGTEADYAKGVGGLYGSIELAQMFVPLLEKMDDEGFPWAEYDLAGGRPNRPDHPTIPDDKLDHLVVIHSGTGAEFGTANPENCNLNPSLDRIWSQGSGALQSSPWFSNRGQWQINGFSIASAFQRPLCKGHFNEHAIILHEFFHGFFLIDLYDKDETQEINLFGEGGIGDFDPMASVMGFEFDLARPNHMSPFSRNLAGWLDYIEITEDGVYPISPSEHSSLVYQIKLGFAGGEYILIENRQRILWDETMPNSGLVMYHIDDTKAEQEERGYPGLAGWPERHYRVALIPADGAFDIEKGNNRGDENDFWDKAGMVLGPGPDFPNSDSYTLGSTGIKITLLTDSSLIMLFEVEGLNDIAQSSEVAGEAVTPANGISLDTTQEGSESDNTLVWVLTVLGGISVSMGLAAMLFYSN